MKIIEEVRRWDESLADQILEDIKKAIEKEAGVSFEDFKKAYSLVVLSGYYGPFSVHPEDPDYKFSFSEAEDIVFRAVEARFKDYKCLNPEYDFEEYCPECFEVTEGGMCKEHGEVDSHVAENFEIRGRDLHGDFFKEFRMIYG